MQNNTGVNWPYSNIGVSALVTLLCFGFTYLFFGFYYSEYEGLNTAFFTGKLTPGFPFRSLYFSGNMGISYIYSFLYEKFPGIEWLSWIYYAYLFFACLIGLYLVAASLPKGTSVWIKILLQLLVYFLVFSEHHIHLLYTRVAYMICGLSLIGLVVFFNSQSSFKSRWWLWVLLNLFFTIGTLTRNEAAIACFLLVLIWGVFYLQNVKQLVLLFLYPFLLVGSLSVYLVYDIATASPKEFYKQVEPDIEEQFIGRENKVPLADMKTHRDSVLYNTAMNIMWSDPQVISASFLRSLILPEKLMFTDGRQWARVYRQLGKISGRYWYLLLLVVFLSIALFIQYNFQRSVFKWLYWLTFELSFIGLIVAQTYADKVNERSFLPLLGLFTLCHIFLLIRQSGTCRSGWLYPLLTVCLILFGIHCYHLKTESNTLQYDLKMYQSNAEKIKKVAAGKVLVFNSTSFDYLFLSNVPFHPFNFSAFKKMYIPDGYIIPFLPYYKRYLESECRCDIYSFPDFWKYLNSIQEQVVIVSNAPRINVLKEYLQEIHHYRLPVVEKPEVQLMEVQKKDDRGNFEQLKVYVFEK